MKNYLNKVLMLLVFASLVLSSCSVEYRDRRERERRDGRDGRDHHDNRGNEGYHYKAF